jgi:hypothetical protein
MTNLNFQVPILFLTYKRLDTALRVFEKIKMVKPQKLFISSDGPKNKTEQEIIFKLRDRLKSHVDWECDLNFIFYKENLGCRNAVSKSINEFFNHVEHGIILEEDCLPSLSFFYYCEELLERYKYDERIYAISGFNQQNEWNSNSCDYFYSKLGNCWGWATWKRCWNEYDVDIKDFHEFSERDGFVNSLGMELGIIKKEMIYEGAVLKKADTWAMQWGYLRHKKNGLTCIPAKSLIQNIGFGKEATHTKEDSFSHVKTHELKFPLRENPFIVSDFKYDNMMFKKPKFLERVTRWILRQLK